MNIEDMSAEELAELAKKKKAQAKEAERQAKEEAKQAARAEKDELSATAKYQLFAGALRVYNETGMSFFLDKTPQYFRKLTTSKVNRKTKRVESTTEIAWSQHGTLYPCWVELQHPVARDLFRRMINGGTIDIFNPETNETETYQFPPRVYEKLVNTVDEVDDRTYNVLDTSSIMKPNYNKEEPQTCPTIIQALLYAVTGNTIEWDEERQTWVGDKPENLEWFKKWIYGIVHADVGNNMLPMPIIFGSGKVGKNALFEIVIPIILGAELAFVGTWDTVDSGFNAFKLGKVFVFVDEIPERGEWNKVKNATGSLKEYIKTKYGAEFQVDNCIAYGMGSNQTLFPLPFEEGKQMTRVSPIKVVPTSTFAENAVKMLDKERGENYCYNTVKAAGLDADKMTTYELGDSILRNVLAAEWQHRDTIQQFLNHLDQQFSGDTYYLPPLRGQDWDEIAEYKKDTVRATAEFVVSIDPKIISTHEIYEIYKVIQGERNSTMSKQIASVTENIRSYMEAAGYTYKKDAVIAGGTRTNIFCKDQERVRGDLSNYEEDFGRYIDETMVNHRPIRRLRSDMTQAIHPQVRRMLNTPTLDL